MHQIMILITILTCEMSLLQMTDCNIWQAITSLLQYIQSQRTSNIFGQTNERSLSFILTPDTELSDQDPKAIKSI